VKNFKKFESLERVFRVLFEKFSSSSLFCNYQSFKINAEQSPEDTCGNNNED
jgi:hypothetical protein